MQAPGFVRQLLYTGIQPKLVSTQQIASTRKAWLCCTPLLSQLTHRCVCVCAAVLLPLVPLMLLLNL